MALYAGLDRSGTPDLGDRTDRHDPYIVLIGAVEDLEGFQSGSARLRYRLGMRADKEFHGHDLTERVRTEYLGWVQEYKPCFGILIIDKAATREAFGSVDLISPQELLWKSSFVLLERFFDRYPLATLWCDEDLQGRHLQQKFTTRAKSLHRNIWPGRSLKVRHPPSDTSDLIQLADVVGYSLARYIRNPSVAPELQRHLQAIIEDPDNVIIGPLAWTP